MQTESRQTDERFAAERAKLEADPNVQALKDMFGAELNTDSIKLNSPAQSDQARSTEMKGGIGQLMKQAQEMQANMKKAQEEMASLTVTGESGAGHRANHNDVANTRCNHSKSMTR